MVSFLADEHVPSVFITTLRSNGYRVVRAKDEFGEGTDDVEILRYCSKNGPLLLTHDRKDFSGHIHEDIDHAGIVIYTDANYLHDDPEVAIGTVEQILSLYPREELENEVVWLDQWR